MSKLHKTLNWYSLDRAARRLTETLAEEITRNDILQLALEDKLPLRWHIQDHYAQAAILPNPERIPFLRSLGFDENPEDIGEAEGKDRTWAKYAIIKYVCSAENKTGDAEPFLMFDPAPEEIKSVSGFFRIEIQKSPMSKNWINNMYAGTIENVISMDGIIVLDDDGKYWRLLDYNEGKYTPCMTYPDESRLGLTREDLEAFEESLADEPQRRQTAITKETNSLLRLAVGMALKKYQYNPNVERSDVAAKISSDLVLLDTSISLDHGTILKLLRKGIDLIEKDQDKNTKTISH